MRHAALAALLVVLFAAPSVADRVHLTNGRVIEGIVLSQSADNVVVEIGAGEMKLPRSLVARVETAATALDTYRAQASALAPDDVAGWLALAKWARDEGLETRAIEAYQRVVAVDPDNATAQQGLGRVPHGDRWLTPEQHYEALGYVQYEGRWVPPAIALAAEELRLRRIEVSSRLREAEARARTAEAEERRATQLAVRTVPPDGLVTPTVVGPVVFPWWAWPGMPIGPRDAGVRHGDEQGAPGHRGAAGGAAAAGPSRRAEQEGPTPATRQPRKQGAPIGRTNTASVPRG